MSVSDLRAGVEADAVLVERPPVSSVIDALDEMGVGHIIETLQGLGGAALAESYFRFSRADKEVSDNASDGYNSFVARVGESPGSEDARKALGNYDEALTTAAKAQRPVAVQTRELRLALARAANIATELQTAIIRERTLLQGAEPLQRRAAEEMRKYAENK
jgi:hypothetical protein